MLIQHNEDTGSKPYQCKECQRCFSRQDSLARHEKLHTRRRVVKDVVSSPIALDQEIRPESVDCSELSNGTSYSFSETTSNDTDGLNDVVSEPAVSQSMNQGAELDFDLIWPDSEDLFQTIMSTEKANQWEIPLGTLPFSVSPDTSNIPFETPSSFDERPSSIGTIPSGGNSQAVQDVSKMISNLV